MNFQRKQAKTFLRRSVPKLFLILSASIPAAGIPTYLIAKNQKENSIKYVEGDYVGSKVNEPLSPHGRFTVGQKENNNRFNSLIGENPGPLEEKTPATTPEATTPAIVEVPKKEEKENIPLPNPLERRPQLDFEIAPVKTLEELVNENLAIEAFADQILPNEILADPLSPIASVPIIELPSDEGATPVLSIPKNRNVEIPDVNQRRPLPEINIQTPSNLNKIPAVPPSLDLQLERNNSLPHAKDCLEPLSLNPRPFLQFNRPDFTEIAATEVNTSKGQTKEELNPRSLLKMYPLRPEHYNKNLKKTLRNQPLEPSVETPEEIIPPDVELPANTDVEPIISPDVEAPISPDVEAQVTPDAEPAITPDVEVPVVVPMPSEELPSDVELPPASDVLPQVEEEAIELPETELPGTTLKVQETEAPVTPQVQIPVTTPQVTTPATQESAVPLPQAAEPAQAIPEITDPNAPIAGNTETGYLTNFTNLDIKEYIRFISRITNKNFVFNESDLGFTISMISQKKETAEELINTLMQQLRIHGLAVIEEGNTFIIHTNPEVNAPATVMPRSPDEEVPENAQIITQVFRLSVVEPSRAMAIIKPLLSSQAIIEPLDEAGILTLTDLRVNIDKIRDLLHQLDFPSSGLDVSHFNSQFINAETLAGLGEKVLTPLAEGRELRLIPLKGTNTLFIISSPIMVRRAVEFFEALDKEIKLNGSAGNLGKDLGAASGGSGETVSEKERLTQSLQQPLEDLNQTLSTSAEAAAATGTTNFELYKLEYRKGDQIQQALQQIADSLLKVNQTDASGAVLPTSDLFNAISSVQWIEASNTLIFTGTSKANEKIKQLIVDLDVPNQQVLIEMLLLDTSIDKSYAFGVDWGSRFGGPNLAGSQAFTSPSSPFNGVMDQSPNGGLNAENLTRATGFSLGVIGQTISCDGLTFSTLGALVSALHNTDMARVVLNPKIVVEENTSAEVFAGLNIPFKTQSIANDFGTILTSNFEYRDIGARMKVTPIINKNGIITLEIEQELQTLVSSTTSVITNSFFDAQALSGAGPTTRKSNSKTTLFVPNGYFVILSGMLQDESERERRQVPCLGGVPVLGGAFSQKRNRVQNRNLIIFIRPSLINTPDEMTYFTKREQDIYDQKCREKDLWKYEIDEALDFLNINQDPCR